MPAPTPDSATNATSGNALADAGQAQTTSDNTQLGVGSAAGGTGALTVTNQHTGSVVDSSSASAQSGLAVALAPTVLPGTAVPTGVTVANSGSTTASGLQAQNNVSNTSVGAVQVVGANQAPVALSSRSNVAVNDIGASGAASGAAWAVAAGADGSPSGVAAPVVAGAAPTSGPMSATGLLVQNTPVSTLTATLTIPGGPQSRQPISLTTSQNVSVLAGNAAQAASGAACAGGATCASPAVPAAPLATIPAANAVAASGSASAQGLIAQNTVNTNATVGVHIGGQNFAPIQVVINSVTQIFNFGVASATSGDTTAGNGSGSGAGANAGQPASSGSAQATGAQVQNTVNLRSSAAVHVTGDNYDPITLMLNLAANLVNWGTAQASSGDAQSSGSGNGSGGRSASSGAAKATGLQAMNIVNMWADAAVDVDGNNYAPIYVYISFNTNIENYGVAQANSGNVAAGTSTTTATSSSQPGHAQPASSSGGTSGGSKSSGSVGKSSTAQGGNAVAVSNTVNANIASLQVGNANGGKPLASAEITSMLRNLPTGSWDPFVQKHLPTPAVPAVQDGLASRSGDAVATGLQSLVDLHNTQVAVCTDPGVVCVAGNAANLSVDAEDSPTNLATGEPGGTTAVASASFSNVTPTPTPTAAPRPNADGAGDGTDGDQWFTYYTYTYYYNNYNGGGGGRGGSSLDVNLLPNGHVVLVDIWDDWPGRRLPPMPNPTNHAPAHSSVSAAIDGEWPGADELPLPELAGDGADTAQAAGVAVQSAARPRPAVRLADSAADDGDQFPVMAIADVDPWGPGPALAALPMPGQAPRSVASVAAAPPVDSSPGPVAAQQNEPDESGATPVGAGMAALLSAVVGLVSLTRGRRVMRALRGATRLVSTGGRTR